MTLLCRGGRKAARKVFGCRERPRAGSIPPLQTDHERVISQYTAAHAGKRNGHVRSVFRFAAYTLARDGCVLALLCRGGRKAAREVFGCRGRPRAGSIPPLRTDHERVISQYTAALAGKRNGHVRSVWVCAAYTRARGGRVLTLLCRGGRKAARKVFGCRERPRAGSIPPLLSCNN